VRRRPGEPVTATGAADRRRRASRVFAGESDEPRARRTSDLVELGLAAMALALTSISASPAPRFVRALADLMASLPGFVDGIGQLLSDFVAAAAIVVLAAAAVQRRGRVLRDLVVAIAAASVLWLLVGRFVEGSWPSVWASLREAAPPRWYPAPRVAIPAAVLLTAVPYLIAPLRRLVWWLVLGGALAVSATGAANALDATAGILVAIITSAAVHYVFGSCAGRPSLEQVHAALSQLGVRVASVGAADRQHAGYFLVHAISESGEPLVVKVYGRDAHDSALVTTLWRTVWYREPGSPLRFGRLQQVEHEALLTLLSAQAGAATDRVVVAGLTANDDALLVVERDTVTLADALDDAPQGAELVRAIWELVGRLHRSGIAHGQIDDQHLSLRRHPDGTAEVGLIDFRGATVAASTSRLRTDEAQALVTSALLTDPELAVAGALEALGPEGLAATVPFLQPPALTPDLVAHLRGPRSPLAIAEEDDPRPATPVHDADGRIDLAALRAAAAAVAGIEEPELWQLRRITVGSILRLVLPAIAVVSLVSALGGIDFSDLMDQLADATWLLVILGFVVSQLPRLSQSVSTLGASPIPLPLGPVYALQLATSYVNVAIPATAARVAVNVRFFQRHGVPPGTAIAAGALDAFSGFVVQVIALITILGFSSASLDLDLGGARDSAGRVLVIVLVVLALAVGAIFVIGRLRRFVLYWLRRLGREAMETIRGLQSPRRLAMLLGGNLASETLFAVSLGVFTRSLGYPIGLGELLLICISVSLLAGIMPVPGGIGVSEGGLTFGLVQAGMPDALAFAAVIMYRLATFYLPPLWGYFALRWLERNDHL